MNTTEKNSLLALPARAIAWLNTVPYSLAVVFWNSGMTKLANWDSTLYLFAEEYRVPVLPPEFAAYMATTMELTTPVLLVLGLLVRSTALALLGMTAVIQLFVYPGAWPTHIQWVAMLLILLTRGAGAVSLDHVLANWLGLRPQPA